MVLKNANVLAESLISENFDIVTGGTDNHLVLVKTDSTGLTGKDAEAILEKVGITCNKNVIPNDKRSPFVTSGIRLGTPAITTRGLDSSDVNQISRWMARALKNPHSEDELKKISDEIRDFCHIRPLYTST